MSGKRSALKRAGSSNKEGAIPYFVLIKQMDCIYYSRYYHVMLKMCKYIYVRKVKLSLYRHADAKGERKYNS
jgi:hypothetical protein